MPGTKYEFQSTNRRTCYIEIFNKKKGRIKTDTASLYRGVCVCYYSLLTVTSSILRVLLLIVY